MLRSERMQAALQEALAPTQLEVRNDSHLHSVPPNSETHFSVLVVSEHFANLSRVQRHQAIHRVLMAEFEGGLHALSIHAMTVDEWEASEKSHTKPPPCLSGRKDE